MKKEQPRSGLLPFQTRVRVLMQSFFGSYYLGNILLLAKLKILMPLLHWLFFQKWKVQFVKLITFV